MTVTHKTKLNSLFLNFNILGTTLIHFKGLDDKINSALTSVQKIQCCGLKPVNLARNRRKQTHFVKQ